MNHSDNTRCLTTAAYSPDERVWILLLKTTKRVAYRALGAKSDWTCLIFCEPRATYMSQSKGGCCFLSQSGLTVIYREPFHVCHPLQVLTG